METREEITCFRTADLALVAYLDMEDHKYTRMEEMDGKAICIFRVTDGFMDLVECFQDGNAEVEPKEYLQATAGVRRRMQRFIGIEPYN